MSSGMIVRRELIEALLTLLHFQILLQVLRYIPLFGKKIIHQVQVFQRSPYITLPFFLSGECKTFETLQAYRKIRFYSGKRIFLPFPTASANI